MAPDLRLVLVAGGLGVGKTRLVRRLLGLCDGRRLGAALCSEDLAAVARALGPRHPQRWDCAPGGFEVLALQGGSVACGFPAARGGALAAARTLLSWVEVGGRLDLLLVELESGEDPSAAAALLRASAPKLRLAAGEWTVAVLDAPSLDTFPHVCAPEPSSTCGGAPYDSALLKHADVMVVDGAEDEDRLTALVRQLRGSLDGLRLLRAPLGRAEAAAALPPTPAPPGGGAGRGCRWSQTKHLVRVEVPVVLRASDLELRIDRQFFRLAARGQEDFRVEGTLFAEVRAREGSCVDVRDNGMERVATVALEKRRARLWPDLWRPEEAPLPAAAGAGGASPPLSRCATYRRHRPFRAARLRSALAAAKAGGPLSLVLRSKGRAWLDDDPLRVQEWSHSAGRTPDIRPGSWWWAVLDAGQAAVLEAAGSGEAVRRRRADEEWDEAWGDRGQALLLACRGGPPAEAREAAGAAARALDECLLTDEELAEFRGRREAHEVPEALFFAEEEVTVGALRGLGVGGELGSSEDDDGEDGNFEAAD